MAADRSKVLQQAQLLASRGQYDAAIAEWKKLAAESPNDGSIHNSIGDLHLKRNAVGDAIMSFLQAAAAFRAEGATLKALAAFKKVLKSDPTRYEVYRHLGDLNAERGLLSSAVQDYLTLGKHYLKEGKSKEALEVYKKIVSQDPSNLDAQQRVAELCVQENLQDEATKVYLQLGRERSAQGRFDEAKDAYLAVLRIDPKNSEAAQFVESEERLGTGAVKALKQSTVHKSSEPLDLLAEATRRIDEKQYAGAEAILNQLLTREPGNPQVCQLLARLHLQRGDVRVALGEYRFLAGAALRAQDYQLAESLIQEFLSAEPNSVPLLELYGELLEEKGDRMEAARRYARAVELLLEYPEPGMDSLHEELFEKVKVLSTDSELVSRLAATMNGSVLPPPVNAPVPVEHCSLQRAEPSKSDHSTESGRSEPEQEFSLLGAVPDEVRPLEGPLPSEDDAQASLSKESVSIVLVEKTASPPLLEEPHLNGENITVDQPPTIHMDNRLSSAQLPVAVKQVMPVLEPSVLPVDCEAHFTLGVAYKNMSLYKEAQEEFEIAKAADTFYLDASLMTALCLKESQELVAAIGVLEPLLTDPLCQGAKDQAVRYELGLLYEAKSLWEEAVRIYQSIPSFHDVPERLEALKERCRTVTGNVRGAD